MSKLYCNIDCNCFFYTPLDGRPGDSGQAVDRYVDRIAEAGVDVLLVNTNARRTNYRSAAWEAFWDGYDPRGPDDQSFLAAIPAEQVRSYRQMLDAMMKLHESGVDYPQRMLAGAKRHGMQAWVSLRMNDVHEGRILQHPFHGRLWREHPEFCRQYCQGYFRFALDYAQPQVREYFGNLIAETLQRYDIDGLELDFMREPYLFSKDAELAGGRILTAWLEEIRRWTQSALAQRGHKIRLGVRVPSNPNTSRRMGLDAVAWAKAGLVDLIVPTPRWTTMEFDLPLRAWRKQLAGSPVILAGGLEVRVQGVSGGPWILATPEHALGAASAAWAAGADAVYLFNYFPSQHPDWAGTDYVKTLRAMSRPTELAMFSRRHTLTFRDIVGPGETYQPPLPAEGVQLEFHLPTGPRPSSHSHAVLEVGLDPAVNRCLPSLTVNGQACVNLASDSESPTPIFTSRYAVPIAALEDGDPQRIVLVAGDGQPIRVVQVEMRISPASAGQ